MEQQFPKNVRQIGNVSDNPKIYVEDYVDTFLNYLGIYLRARGIETVYLDFDKLDSEEADTESYRLARYIQKEFPYVQMKNLQEQLRAQRTIKYWRSMAFLCQDSLLLFPQEIIISVFITMITEARRKTGI